MKFSDAQKQMLASMKQSFAAESFGSFEETYESLMSRDVENKKLVLDQVSSLYKLQSADTKEQYSGTFFEKTEEVPW